MVRISILIVILMLHWGVGGLKAQEVAPDTTAKVAPAAQDTLDEAALEEELRRALEEEADSLTEQAPSVAPLPRGGSSGGRTLNPRISVVGTFFAAGTGNQATAKTYDGGLSEAEISLNAYVDPYSKADFFVAFRHETEDPFEGPDSGIAAEGEFAPELEEAFFTTLSLPFGLQIKAGKFRSNFGKINQTHPHAYNFLDMPRMYVNFLGEEGLGDRGVSVNWLVPNPLDFYQELTVEITSGAVESPSFAGGSNKLLYLGHLKNFFDLTENATLELGFTGVVGPHNGAGNETRIGAVDVTYRWKPLRRNRYQSVEWMTEALISEHREPGGTITSRALYSFLRYQLARRWFLGARFDYSEFPDNRHRNEKAYSLILSFFATEYQKIEVQYQHGRPAERDPFHRLLLRAVFVIGAHGAHKY